MSRVLHLYFYHRIKDHMIEKNVFYHTQAKARLISQFANIETEANTFEKAELERISKLFDPDIHDEADVYEQAYQGSVEHYLLLDDMRQNTILSIAGGLYAQWEKELREWLDHELQSAFTLPELRDAVWKKNISEILDLFECLGWDLRKEPFFKKLDACRNVVNVYKHGRGSSFDALKNDYPEYIDDPLAKLGNSLTAKHQFVDHTNLSVTENQLDEFADAISNFWQQMPDRQFFENAETLPKWLEKPLRNAGMIKDDP